MNSVVIVVLVVVVAARGIVHGVIVVTHAVVFCRGRSGLVLVGLVVVFLLLWSFRLSCW